MKTNIIKIILLTIVALLLCGILFTLLTKNEFKFIKFGDNQVLLKNNTFAINKKKITINTKSADIKIKESNDDLIHVELYGKNDDDYTVEENDNIKISENKKNIFCLGFCSYKKHITIYLPNNYISEIDLKTISGDVTVEKELFTKTNINTTSGDIKLKRNNEIKINTVSGDIELEYATKIEIGTTSGDVLIDTLNLENNSFINTVSGDININKTNNIYINTHTVSGDVRIEKNIKDANSELKINTTSGDIYIKN